MAEAVDVTRFQVRTRVRGETELGPDEETLTSTTPGLRRPKSKAGQERVAPQRPALHDPFSDERSGMQAVRARNDATFSEALRALELRLDNLVRRRDVGADALHDYLIAYFPAVANDVVARIDWQVQTRPGTDLDDAIGYVWMDAPLDVRKALRSRARLDRVIAKTQVELGEMERRARARRPLVQKLLSLLS